MNKELRFWIGIGFGCLITSMMVGLITGNHSVYFMISTFINAALFMGAMAGLVYSISGIGILMDDHEEVKLLRQQVNKLIGIEPEEIP